MLAVTTAPSFKSHCAQNRRVFSSCNCDGNDDNEDDGDGNDYCVFQMLHFN